MQTPYFPSLRSRLAALGQRTVQTLRHTSLPQLDQCLGTYLPVHLLSSEDEGTNSRERISLPSHRELKKTVGNF
jgi:hypothetical protein